jgi:hypothetical protein
LEEALVVRGVGRRLSDMYRMNGEEKPLWMRKQKIVKSRFTAIVNMKTSGLMRTNPGFVTGKS